MVQRRASVASVVDETADEVGKALPLTRGNVTDQFVSWLQSGRDICGIRTPSQKKVSLLSLFSYSTNKERWLMVFGLIAAGFSGLGLPAWLVLLAKSLNKFNNLARLAEAVGRESLETEIQNELNKLVVAFVIVGVIVLFAGSIYVSIFTYTGEKQSLRIQELFVRSALKQDASWFDSHNREELPTTIATSMVHINGAIGRQIADVFANAVTAAGCLAVALVLNAPLALLMLLVVPIVAVIISILSCFIRKKSYAAATNLSKAGAIATETISGIKTVASLCAQPWALSQYDSLVCSSQKFSIRSGILSSLVAGITGFLFYVTYTFAFIIGSEQVANDATMTKFIQCIFSDDPNCRVTGASVMCCIYGVVLCATFFGLMTPGIQAINLGRQAADDIFATIDRIPEIDSSSDSGKKVDNIQGKLELRNVYFAYPSRPDKPIFFDLNLVVEPGQSIGLCGPSGSGKSTIAKLLLRFYDPVTGDVQADGMSLREMNVNSWRSQVGYVAQEPTLFPGTIRYNIAVGKPGASDEEVIAAATAACAHDFIMDLPDGYDTYYSGTSITLSGGQMQRVVLSRAIIRQPAVLLLDEATSALDSHSEGQVQQALENIRKVRRMTTVSVAHRLSTIIDSDQIAVISDGAIAEQGTHRDLFEKNGIYTTLCQSQGITADSRGAEVDSPTVDTMKGPIPSAPVPTEESDLENGFEDVDKPDKLVEEEKAPLSRLWKYTSSDILYSLLGIVGSAMVGALSPAESILTAQIVANFYTQEAEDIVDANLKWCLGFLVFAGTALAGNLMFGCLSVSGCRLARRLRVDTFGTIVRQEMGWFDFPEHSVGELTTRLAADTESVSNITGWQLGYQIRTISSLLTGVVIALVYSWQVGLIAIACIPFIMAAAVVQVICLKRRFVAKQGGLSPATILEQGLRGIAAVQAYNLQLKVGDDYAQALEPESAEKVKKGVIAGLTFGFSQFSIFASFAVVFYAGSLLLVSGKVDFVSFFTPVLAVMFGAVGAAQVSAEFSSRQKGQVAAARIFAIVDSPVGDADPFSKTGEKPSTLDGAITFRSVQFHYPTRPDIPIYYKSDQTDGLSLSIAAKESVAFVGRSGCGKSTAEQLVLRFYKASAGDVLVDDLNVIDYNITWLRHQIGYVGQQPVLFDGTVRQNILLGKPDATEEEVIAAARAANAHGFIMEQSDGYDTDIGSGGSLLSGGQRQRIAIARAIIKNPPILVLDEATAALDNVSERVVQAALDELQKTQPRTTLVVAHRLMTVKNCDKIAVLADGGVKECGSHESLLAQNGLYHELWKMQGATEDEHEKKNL